MSRQRHETHVIPSTSGGWDVVRPGVKSASRFVTQREAERHARKLIERLGGGEVVIHGKDGRIRESDTVRPRLHKARAHA
jgi:Uncharacterized protein conserved in bacteria (DUF2188)